MILLFEHCLPFRLTAVGQQLAVSDAALSAKIIIEFGEYIGFSHTAYNKRIRDPISPRIFQRDKRRLSVIDN